MRSIRHLRFAALAALAAAIALPAFADPPSHAPAHGWRKKNDPYYVGYTGHRWPDDYGIRAGRCDRDRVGAALGAVIGREIGDEMDDRDRACFGHSLELLEDGRRVSWDGGRRGTTFTLAPDGRFERDGRVCRHFTLTRMQDGRPLSRQGNACRYGEGDWQMIKA